ncbi:MAG: hypothetical protein ACLFTT_05100 [Candidatus Hydrogenedentota bacterium]
MPQLHNSNLKKKPADYEDRYTVDADKLKAWLKSAEAFVAAAKRLLETF